MIISSFQFWINIYSKNHDGTILYKYIYYFEKNWNDPEFLFIQYDYGIIFRTKYKADHTYCILHDIISKYRDVLLKWNPGLYLRERILSKKPCFYVILVLMKFRRLDKMSDI